MTHNENHIARVVWTADGEQKTHHVYDRTREGVYALAHIWAQGHSLDKLEGRYKVQYVGGSLVLSTDQIREGDVIHNHGMRILIDGPAKLYERSDDPADKVYAWPGLVTNADELCDKGSESYDPYIACHLRGQWYRDRVPLSRRDDWSIVGNHRATWTADLRPTV